MAMTYQILIERRIDRECQTKAISLTVRSTRQTAKSVSESVKLMGLERKDEFEHRSRGQIDNWTKRKGDLR